MKPDMKLLRDALTDVNSCAEWASQAGLHNISTHMKMAAGKIRSYLLSVPTRQSDEKEGG